MRSDLRLGLKLRSTTDSEEWDSISSFCGWKVEERERGMIDLKHKMVRNLVYFIDMIFLLH